jgi:hypothetical protein
MVQQGLLQDPSGMSELCEPAPSAAFATRLNEDREKEGADVVAKPSARGYVIESRKDGSIVVQVNFACYPVDFDPRDPDAPR